VLAGSRVPRHRGSSGWPQDSANPATSEYFSRLRERLLPTHGVRGWGYRGPRLLAAAGSWGVFSLRQPSIDHLLASRTRSKRTLDCESQTPPTDRPADSRRSGWFAAGPSHGASRERGQDRRALEKDPASPPLLEAKGAPTCCIGTTGAAIASLRRALDLQPDSPALMTDLASLISSAPKQTTANRLQHRPRPPEPRAADETRRSVALSIVLSSNERAGLHERRSRTGAATCLPMPEAPGQSRQEAAVGHRTA